MTRKESWSIEPTQTKKFNPLLEKELIKNNGKNSLLALINNKNLPEVNATQQVLDNLSAKLNKIKIISLRKYESNGDHPFNENYLTVAETMERMGLIFQKISSIPLIREEDIEKRRNDGSYIYNHNKWISLKDDRGSKTINSIKFFIRPEPVKKDVKKEAISAMEIKFKDGTIPRTAEIGIENDGDPSRMMFDLFISNTDKKDPLYTNIVDLLNLKEAGQKTGHHFECDHTLPEGITSKDLHKTINRGLIYISDKTKRIHNRQKTHHKSYYLTAIEPLKPFSPLTPTSNPITQAQHA